MISQVDDRLAGKSAGTALALYTTITHNDAGPFARNASCWLADMVESLTCISPSNSAGNDNFAGTAITRRHVLYTKHGGVGVGFPANGTTLRFVASNNAITLRTQSQHKELTPDIAIALLSSDLPAAITPCPVVPDDLMSYLELATPTPVLILDQEEKGLVHDLRSVDVQSKLLYFMPPANAQRLAFHEPVVPGDSADPVFALINNVIALISLLTGESWGPSIAGLGGILNQGILDVDALGGASTGYTVTPISLSLFGKGVAR